MCTCRRSLIYFHLLWSHGQINIIMEISSSDINSCYVSTTVSRDNFDTITIKKQVAVVNVSTWMQRNFSRMKTASSPWQLKTLFSLSTQYCRHIKGSTTDFGGHFNGKLHKIFPPKQYEYFYQTQICINLTSRM